LRPAGGGEGRERQEAHVARSQLDRSAPTEIAIDLDDLRKDGLDLKHIADLTLRLKSDGRAGRLLVGGMVSPRPALSKGGE
jgi:hypothetical protein